MKENIIVDLDGTLSLDHKRAKQWLHLPCQQCQSAGCPTCKGTGKFHAWEPYFQACDEDELNEAVFAVINRFYYDFAITIISGRSDAVLGKTKSWLNKHKVPYHDIVLRPEHNRIDDNLLKLGLAKERGLTPENTLFVLEDRQRVVNAWREAGFTCFQVAPGNF